MSASASRDPICGMPVDPATALSTSFEGRDYFFCSELCRDAFRKGPAQALARRPPTAEDEGRRERQIAYFTMEIALEPRMATYSGGLGVLAGDTVRACADLGIPLVAVTLLHREGYLRQTLDPDGNQREEPERWPIGEYLEPLAETTEVSIEGRPVRVRGWRRVVWGESGRTVPVIFLDTDLAENTPADRALTGRLYGGDERYRLAQEIVLGVGGLRALAALGYHGIRKYHLNEGHAALAPLELLRQANLGRPESEWSFAEAHERCVFTTHTPVSAGHDQFGWDLVEKTVGWLVPRPIFQMVGGGPRLNMTSLSLNLSGFVNGVARRHAEVSRAMFPGYGIHHVTNGVHSRTWTSLSFQRLYDQHLPGWGPDPSMLRNVGRIPDQALWDAHATAKSALVETVQRLAGRSLERNALMIGFARRATQYKRADLVLSDLRRLREIRARTGPMALVFAGKAHPRDTPGKDIIRHVVALGRELADEIPLVYLPNYDLELARIITAGVDVWLNTPERPLEASGTSGMKAAHNGVPSLSVLDGWWLEGHVEGVTGWSIGTASGTESSADAGDLYAKLELIARLFHGDRSGWLSVMRHAISLNASFFNTHRMVQRYVANAYL
jgi:starch phosphorylase